MTTTTISKPGVIAGETFKGFVEVKADGAVFNDCTFDGQFGQYCIRNTTGHYQNTRLIGCRLHHAKKGALLQNARLEDCLFYEHGEDGLFIGLDGNTAVIDCDFSRIGLIAGFNIAAPHCDAIQSGGGTNIIIRRPHIDMRRQDGYAAANSGIFLESKWAPLRDVYILGPGEILGGQFSIVVTPDVPRRPFPAPQHIVIDDEITKSGWTSKVGPYSFVDDAGVKLL